MESKEIKEIFSNFDSVERLQVRKEIAALPSLLLKGEIVLAGVAGMFDGFSGTTGLLTATDRRLLFVDCGMLWGRKVTDFPFEAISSITAKTGLVYGSVLIKASNADAEISHVVKARVQPFVDCVRPLLRKGEPNTKAASSIQPNLTEQLINLADLRSAGHLSDEEFLAAKSKLLDN